jgi:hypothetical protein
LLLKESLHQYFSFIQIMLIKFLTLALIANPVTNIEGAVLGYFSAHTLQIKKVVIH